MCYPKGHLLGGGIWVGLGKDAGELWQPHFWRLAATSHMTSAPWPLHQDLTDSGLHWNHLFITSLFLHSFVHTFVFAFLHNWEINDFKTNPVNPWWTLDVLMIQETVYHSDRPLGLLCVLYPVCTCVSEWLIMSAWVWECVSGTRLYCTIQLPLFANVESYRMNWTVTWSKSYAIFCGQLLNFFIELRKKKRWTSTHI